MLYLLTPDGRVQWTDMPATTTLDLAAEHGADLARLDWQPAELPFSEGLVRLAVRHGVACSDGLVIRGVLPGLLGRGAELRKGLDELEVSQRALEPHDQLMERLAPGWIAHGEQLNREVAESVHDSAAEADAKAAELMAAPPRLDLVEHWVRLGGTPVS